MRRAVIAGRVLCRPLPDRRGRGRGRADETGVRRACEPVALDQCFAAAGAGVLLHLVRHEVVAPGEDRLSAGRPILQRRPGCHAGAGPLGEARRDRRIHRLMEGHADARPSTRAVDRHRRSGALQARHHLPGSRFPPTAPADPRRSRTTSAFFTATFAHRTPFQLFAKPTVIWSGTWEFSAADIARATGPVRSTVSVLGSEKNVDGYRTNRALGRRGCLLLVVGEPRDLQGLHREAHGSRERRA